MTLSAPDEPDRSDRPTPMYRDRRLALPLRRMVVDDDDDEASPPPPLARGRLRSRRGHDVDALPHAWHHRAPQLAREDVHHHPGRPRAVGPQPRRLGGLRLGESSFSSKYAGGVVTAFKSSSSASSRNRRNSCESCWSPSVNRSRVGARRARTRSARSCASRERSERPTCGRAHGARSSLAPGGASRGAFLQRLAQHKLRQRGRVRERLQHAAAKQVFPRFTSPRKPRARSNIATRLGGACGPASG